MGHAKQRTFRSKVARALVILALVALTLGLLAGGVLLSMVTVTVTRTTEFVYYDESPMALRSLIFDDAPLEEIVETINTNPTLLNQPFFDGRGPLHWAVSAERADLVRHFLAAGFDPTARPKGDSGSKEMTPLEVAVFRQDKESLGLILDWCGNNPRHRAALQRARADARRAFAPAIARQIQQHLDRIPPTTD